MAHDHVPECRTETEQDEPLFATRMVRVVNQHCVVIEERCLSFLKRNAVLALVLGVLPLVPFEAQLGHRKFYCKYIVMEIKRRVYCGLRLAIRLELLTRVVLTKANIRWSRL